MPLGSTFVQNDSAAAAQTWTRAKIGADGSVTYVNDTKRALGHREEVKFSPSTFQVTVGAAVIPMVRYVIAFERQLSTDSVPFRWLSTYTFPKALQDSVTTIRTLLKDMNVFFQTGLQSSDAKVDDIASHRAHVP